LAEGLALPAVEVARMLARADDEELAAAPAALLVLARVLEPPLRLAERTAALDRLAALSTDPALLLQLQAERAVDAARLDALDTAEELAVAVLDGARTWADEGQDAEAAAHTTTAAARATEALGRVYAWRGTAAAVARARVLYDEAIADYAALGTDQWRGTALFWSANTLCLQQGELDQAEQGLRRALPLLGPARRAMALTYLGDVLGCVGRRAEATVVLDEAVALAAGEAMIVGYAGWSRAKLASYSGDAQATLRLVVEVDRDLTALDLPHTVATWRADAAEMLDRVGETRAASDMLRQAQGVSPHDGFVRTAAASSLALHGDPDAALAALRQVLLEPWLERRMLWRNTLLTAWATLRAGRPGAGQLAARALRQVTELGGVRVAQTMEPALLRALAPLAAVEGSREAAQLLDGGGTVVRLLGDGVIARNGAIMELPSGRPGELARLVLCSPSGLVVDTVLEELWPGEADDVSRSRLRTTLSRLGARCPGLVVRAGERLQGLAWVDVAWFESAARAALAGGDVDAAHAVLAGWGGTPLPGDPFSSWAADVRERLQALRVRLLDRLAEQAARRGDPRRAAALLEQAIEDDPHDETRHLRALNHHLACGDTAAARRVAELAHSLLTDLGLPVPDEVADLCRLPSAAGGASSS